MQCNTAKEPERTAADNDYIEFYHDLMLQSIYRPIEEFEVEFTVPSTFKYLGKGVKMGDTTRIVCFYKLKETGKYRAVYGDLHASDIDPKDLPLPAQ